MLEVWQNDVTDYSLCPSLAYSYKITLTLDGPRWPNLGYMYVALAGDRESTKEFRLYV